MLNPFPTLRPALLLSMLLAVLLAACGGDDEATPLPATLSIEAPARSETGTATRFGAGSAPAGPDLQWLWNFGDGQTSTRASPQHTYATPGRYTVTLSLRNSAGQEVQGTHTVQAGAFARLEGRDCSQGAGAGWCWMAPSTAARAVRDVHFADALHGVAVGELGHVVVTRDGGASWQRQAPAIDETLGFVRLADAQQAWAVATVSSRLLRSRDGGRSWAVMSSLPVHTVRELWVTSAGAVVINGLGPGLVSGTWVSGDAGANWRRSACDASGLSRQGTLWSGGGRRVSHDLGLSCRALWADDTTTVLGGRLNEDAAVAFITATRSADGGAESHRLWTSSDGGRSFSVTTARFPDLPAGSAPADLRLGSDGRGIGRIIRTSPAGPGPAEPSFVLVTSDGGRSWRLAPDFRDNREIDPRTQASAYLDDRAIWYRYSQLNAQRQRQGLALVVGADEPASILVQIPGESDSPFDLRRAAGGALLAGFGEFGVQRWYSSTDAGRSWVALPGSAGAEPDVAGGGVWFFDSREGLMLRSDGVVLATEDGGRSWLQRAVLGSGFAYGLSFTADGTGWAVSQGGLYRSTDRGRQWQPMAGPGLSLRQARFVDARTGWVTDDQCTGSGNVVFCEGRLYRTRDGGLSWTALPGANIGDYTPMAFADAQRGAWVDWDGSIRHTRDGGDTWSSAQVDVPLNQRAAKLVFDRQGRGWLLPFSDRSRLLRSLDGGASWQSVTLPAVTGLTFLSAYNSIAFGDDRNGWLVGSGGVVLASKDGGNTWRRQALGTERTTSYVFAIDGQTAWIAGSYPATLLTTSTGGD